MIRTVVFDIGGVLKGWRKVLPELFGEEIGGRVYAAMWGTGLWKEMDRGTLSEEEILARMIAADPGCGEQTRYYFEHIELSNVHRDYAKPWVQELKSRGLAVYYLSNYSRLVRRKSPEVLDFLPYMDGGIFSCDVQLMKPDPAIYRMLLEKYRLNPAECLFVDDKQENVDAAIACGMQAVRFRGYEESYPEIMEMLSSGKDKVEI